MKIIKNYLIISLLALLLFGMMAGTASAAPTYTAITGPGANEITLTFSENVDSTLDSETPWSLSGTDSTGLTVTGITDLDGTTNTAVLTISGNIPTSSDLSVDYDDTDGNADIEDLVANPLATASIAATDGLAPTMDSAITVTTTTIDVTFSEEIVNNSATLGDFVITGVVTNPTVTGLSVSGSVLTLTLDAAMTDADVPFVAYTATGGSIDDLATPANSLADFAAQPVTNNLDTAPAISSFTVSPSTGISSNNPATSSADVSDANLKGVEFIIIDSNNLVRDINQTVIGIHSNYSGISGTYTSLPWNAVFAMVTNGTVGKIATVFYVEGIDGCSICPNNVSVLGLFKKNDTEPEILVDAWFSLSTFNLSAITTPEGNYLIENGISTIRFGNIEFANGLENPPELFISAKIFTIYNIGDESNPYLINVDVPGDIHGFSTVPSGNYTVLVHAFDTANNHNATSLNITTARLGDGKIRGMKWNDSNGNGIRDNGELGVAGVEIWLTRMIAPGDGQIAGYTSTDLNGNYSFVGLAPGFYKVEESPGDRTQTFPANGRPHFVDLGPGMVREGVDFGNQPVAPGEIRGVKFNDTNGNGTQDPEELGILGTSICIWPSWRCTTTDINGNYSFLVPAGTYTVYEILPSGRVATMPTWVTVTVTSSEVKTVNFGNRMLVPPPPDVSIGQQYGTQNGVPTILRPGLTTLTIRKNLTNISENVVAVNLTLNWSDGTTKRAGMTRIGTTNVWEATFSPPWPSGTAQMRFEVDVDPAGPGVEDAVQIGDIIFIDPSGQIKDACTGAPISGATATLLVEFPPTTGNYTVSPPANQIPPDNPLTTGADGRYSWLTVPGSYKVKAEKAGYITAESPPVSVPPPVSGLDIGMTPTGGCPTAPPSGGGGGGGGGTGGGGVTSSEPLDNIAKAERYDKDLIANTPVTYRFAEPEHSIYEVVVTGKENEGNVALRCEALKGASKLVTASAPGTVYKNENIWIGTKRIKEALIRFKVENSWLVGNSVAGSDVKMVKWDGSKWVQIETTEKIKDGTFTYYEAKTDSFSSFAITGLKGVEVPTATPAVAVTETVKPAVAATTPAPAPTEKVPGFELALSAAALCAVYLFSRKRR